MYLLLTWSAKSGMGWSETASEATARRFHHEHQTAREATKEPVFWWIVYREQGRLARDIRF